MVNKNLNLNLDLGVNPDAVSGFRNTEYSILHSARLVSHRLPVKNSIFQQDFLLARDRLLILSAALIDRHILSL
jgi:hypothetical protein